MSPKKVAIALASFGIMAQTAPYTHHSEYLHPNACKMIANDCVPNYASAGYSSAGQCFDERTGGNCAPIEEGLTTTRVWMYYEGPLNFCYGHC